MSDYEYKAKLLKSGLCTKVKQLDRDIYKLYAKNDFNFAFEEAMFCSENNCTKQDIDEARLINNASYHRVKRLNERIERYLSMGECIWLTLTFNDKTLSETNAKTRRRYVSHFLKSQSNYYVANIDYGKDNEREHYHAVVVGSFVDMEKWSKYGFAYTERIKNHLKTSVKLSKYVSKLTNHAIKESTKRQVYVYSRS